MRVGLKGRGEDEVVPQNREEVALVFCDGLCILSFEGYYVSCSAFHEANECEVQVAPHVVEVAGRAPHSRLCMPPTSS